MGRLEGRRLAHEFGADRAARAGDEDALAGDQFSRGALVDPARRARQERFEIGVFLGVE